MVYILHFDKKYHHCQHYTGYTGDGNINKRFERHLNGNGSPLVRAVIRAGINIRIGRTYPEGDKKFERELKNQKQSSRFCNICRKVKNK
jgi:hypothetical protein